MLSSDQKEQLNSFLRTQLKWDDFSFCLCDERTFNHKLITQIVININVTYDDLSKLKEYLKCEKLEIFAKESKQFPQTNKVLVISWK